MTAPTPEPTPDEWIPTDAEARNRSGLLLDRYDAWLAAHDAQVRAEAWDEGGRHESEYLATWGQFCPGTNCNPYRNGGAA